MNHTQLEYLARMRAAVGFLGEREQYGWWQSTFFAAGSRAFLGPVFGRTQLLAQCMGVTRAAALSHDEHIGVGRVFHLFRLPEDVEQGIHRALHTPEVSQRIAELVSRQDIALDYLRAEARTSLGQGVGPTHAGSAHELRDSRHWRTIAAEYVNAFSTQSQVYPYFTDHI